MLSSLQPQVAYWLIDEARCHGLGQEDNVVVLLFQLAHATDPSSFAAGLHKLWLSIKNDAKLTDSAMFWLDVMLRKRGIERSRDLKHLHNEDWTMGYKWGIEKWMEKKQGVWLQEGIEKGLAQGLQQGIDQGIDRGIAQGIDRGASLILKRQLTRRFGPLNEERLKSIDQASREQLEVWAERILSAQSLDQVFSTDSTH